MYTLFGTAGNYLTVTKDAIILFKESSNWFAGTSEKSTVTLPVSNLTGVEYSEPTFWKCGYITFGSYNNINGYLTYRMGVKLRNRHRIESLYLLLRDKIK